METPFVYGKIATGNYFIDREEEVRRLKQNFFSETNTILISPRRWGKSLSEKLLMAVSNKLEENVANTQKFMKQWIPKITFSPDTKQEFSFDLDWQEIKKTTR